jgi:sterol desaturase/sphingolipid hydroxylase (fatty acid hydroxylase superfamily)
METAAQAIEPLLWSGSEELAGLGTIAIFASGLMGLIQFGTILARIKDGLGPIYNVFRDIALLLVPVFSPENRFFWIFCLSFVAGGFALYARGRKPGQRFSLGEGMRFVFPADIYLHKTSRLTYRYYLANGTVMALLRYGGFGVGALALGPAIAAALQSALGASPAYHAGPLVIAGFAVLTFMAIDLAHYVQHWLFHKVPALWEIHKVHHFPDRLNPIMGSLFHPIELLAQTGFGALFASPLVGAMLYYFLSAPRPTILGAEAVLFFFNLLTHFRHSELWLSLPRWLSHIVSSPAMHQTHHSTAARHWDRNYALSLSLWDWLFGTIYIPQERECLEFGLREEPARDFDSVWKLLCLPLLKAARTLWPHGPEQRLGAGTGTSEGV